MPLLLFLLSACASTDTAEPPAELQTFAAEAKINKVWSADIGKTATKIGVKLSPYFTDEQIFMATYSGQITQIDAKKGAVLATSNTNERISAGINGNSDKLFYGTTNGDLVALNRSDFKEVWRIPLQSEILTKPVVAIGLVIARSVDGNIQAFSVNSGEKRWSYKMNVPPLSLHGNGSPIVVDNQILLVGSDSGRLLGLSLDKGRVLFETSLSLPSGSNIIARIADIDMTPSFDGSLLYISSYQNGLSAVNLQQGNIAWRHEASTFRSVVYDDDTLFFTDSNSQIWAVNRFSGETIWTQKGLRARQVSAPVLYKNKIIVTDFEGYIHVLSNTDGRFIARYGAGKPGPLGDPVMMADNQQIFFLANKDGQFSAFDLALNEKTAK